MNIEENHTLGNAGHSGQAYNKSQTAQKEDVHAQLPSSKKVTMSEFLDKLSDRRDNSSSDSSTLDEEAEAKLREELRSKWESERCQLD